jgi:hypothetical protein
MLNPLIDRPLKLSLSTQQDLYRYVFPITDKTPPRLLEMAGERLEKDLLLDYIRDHNIQKTIAAFERKFTARRLHPATIAVLLKTMRHYHNGLRGGLLYLAGRITEDTRLHRSKRDRIGAAAPLFAAFDEFTDSPDYVVSVALPLITAVLEEAAVHMSMAEVLYLLQRKGALKRDEPHLERFYGVVDELYHAGTSTASSDEIDAEDPVTALPEKAVQAYQARKILTTRPDISPAAAAAFMFGNESLAGLLYGKLYKGFKKYQAEYGLSDHACDYFGDHASEDAEAGGPAFEASHANLMLSAVLLYAELGPRLREQTVKGLHLFLETYNALVESLCEAIDQDPTAETSASRFPGRDREAVAVREDAHRRRSRAAGV